MALGAILAAALTDHSARSWGLYVDGVDVIASPVRGNRYGVDITSVVLRDAGPGQVSTLTFTLDDPVPELSITPGATIRFHDIVRNMPLFAGFIGSYSVSSFGVGRSFEVTAVGLEILLDWMYVPGFTIAAGTGSVAGVQAVAAAAIGIGWPLNVAATDGLSRYTSPVGFGPGLANNNNNPVTIPSGTLRAALQAYADFYIVENQSAALGYYNVATVDPFGGLRFYRLTGGDIIVASSTILDIEQTLIRSTGTGTAYPADTAYVVDGSAAQSVYVLGTGAGTGVVPNGTGRIGPTGQLTDASITTAEARVSLGTSFLSQSATYLASGSVTVENVLNVGSLAAQRRAGSYLKVRDIQVGIGVTADQNVIVTSIDKTYEGTTEHWVYHFGADISGASLMRSLTRATIT